MSKFFANQFTLETFLGEVLWDILLSVALWSYLLSAGLRGMVWLFNIPLRGRRHELAFWIIVPLFFIVGAFFVTFLSQVTSQPRDVPLLKGQIDGVGIGIKESATTSTTVITLIVSIRNLGTPSIIEGWTLTVTPPSGTAFTAKTQQIPATLTLHREGRSPITVYSSDALYDRTATTPIIFGGMQRGILLFHIEQLAHHVVSNPGTKLVLSYRDVLGKEYLTERFIGGITEELPYYPGIRTSQ